MNGYAEAAGDLSVLNAALANAEVPYAIIGGLAVVAHGHDRFTQDIDGVLWGADDRLAEIWSVLAEAGFQLRRVDAIDFALRHRILLLVGPSGRSVDLALGMLPFENELITKANLPASKVDGIPYPTIEDLIITKVVAGRDTDLSDVQHLLALHPDADLEVISRQVAEFARDLDMPEILEALNALTGFDPPA